MGIIALDIDGTVADDTHRIPMEVERYLAELSRDWRIMFITGRTFPYGFEALKDCTFPYDYAVYNGAVTFRMPERTILRRHYLSPALLKPLDVLCRQEGTDYLLYFGGDVREHCLYRPSSFSSEELDYFRHRESVGGEPWEPVETFGEIEQTGLCYAKLFGSFTTLSRIAKGIEHRAGVATSLIRDSLREGFAVLLVTHALATKGAALKEAVDGLTIAAGDDLNDLSMLQQADIAIAMETAPPEVQQVADIIAPPAGDHGIIWGLQQALAR